MVDDGEEWTAVVERVLVAQTADLRQLAILANADPKTFYLGTRLDGVDICGQDLRGMQFSDLRLSRVKHDDYTQVDPPWAAIRTRPISVLVASYDGDPDKIEGAARADNLTYFTLSNRGKFSDSVNSGALGVVVASNFDIYTGAIAAKDLEDPRNETLLLISSDSPVESISYLTDRSFNKDAIICIHNGSGIHSSERVVEREIALALGFVAEGNSELIRPRHGQCIFMRVVGDGALPILDACCQIFERAWSAKIQCRELRLLSGDVQSESSETLSIAALFDSRVSHSWVDRPLGLYAIIEVRRHDGYPARYWEEHYRLRVMAALEALRPSERRPALFSGVNDLPLDEVRTSRGRRRPIPVAWSDVVNFRLYAVNRISISEKCDIAWVVYQLVMHNTLCVSARDILSISLEDKISIWSIFGRQLDRFMGGGMGSGGARRRYLGLLLRGAADHEPSARNWSSIIDDETTSIVMEAMEVGPRSTVLEFQLKFRSQGQREVVRARFAVGPDGPRLEIPHRQ